MPGAQLPLMARGVEVLGERITLRQILIRHSVDEFSLLNEELRPDGSWVALDEYRYRRDAAKP